MTNEKNGLVPKPIISILDLFVNQKKESDTSKNSNLFLLFFNDKNQ